MKKLIVTAAFALVVSAGFAAEEKLTTGTVVSHVLRPEQKAFDEARLKQLRLPPGFQINAFAQGIGNARMMVVGEDGAVYVTKPKEGEVAVLKDLNNDGVAETKEVLLSDLKEVHGIAIHGGYIYLASTKKLLRATLKEGKAGTPETLLKDLPDGGQHGRRTIGFGLDGKLYLSIGSTCNNCPETNPEHATLLQINPSNWQRKVFAKGLRNTLGFAWHPETKELWGWDHGSDERGDDLPPEELNQLKENGDYGWPYCYGQKVVDQRSQEPKEGTKEEHCQKSIAPVLEYQAHSAPIGFVFYDGSQFPKEFRNDGFVALRGSWNRSPATGYKIVRVKFSEGKPVSTEDFVSGFLLEGGKAHFGRLAGIAVAKDGSLLFSDDTNGVIYRVSHFGAGKEQSK